MATTLAKVFGVVFVLVAVLGFVQSGPVLGVFETNFAHDLVHLVVGVILLAVSGSEGNARSGLKILGIIYIVLAALGFYVGSGSLLGFIEVNQADNWLHAVLGVLLVVASLGGGKVAAAAPSQPSAGGMGGM